MTFTTLNHSSTLVEIGEVVEKLLALEHLHQKTTNQLKYSAWLNTLALILVTGHGSLFSYGLISHSGNKSRLSYVDTTLT